MPISAVYTVPSEADAIGQCVHVHGPCHVDYNLSPGAAIETANRISNAAIDALMTQPLPIRLAEGV